MTVVTKESQDLGLLITLSEPSLSAGIKATNRKALIDTINCFVDSPGFDGSSDKPYLHVSLEGEECSADYKTETDVPSHSVPCPCGNPKHWLIKYDEEVV